MLSVVNGDAASFVGDDDMSLNPTNNDMPAANAADNGMTSDVIGDDTLTTLDCTACAAGSGVVTSCTTDADTICAPCAPGFYNSDSSAHAQCKVCSSCDANFFELTPCSSTADTHCESCARGFEIKYVQVSDDLGDSDYDVACPPPAADESLL